MKLNSYIAAALGAFILTASVAAHASGGVTGTLNTQVTVNSSATLTLANGEGIPSNTLTFAGTGGETTYPQEGYVQVLVNVSTGSTNTGTIISVSGTDLTGITDGGTLPASTISWNPGFDSGGSWNPGTLSNTPVQMASLPGSGSYRGDQFFQTNIPVGTPADVYTGTITYTVSGY